MSKVPLTIGSTVDRKSLKAVLRLGFQPKVPKELSKVASN